MKNQYQSNPRKPAVAGLFYPENRDELAREVARLLEDTTVSVQSKPKALIVPHAGYYYSGRIAAMAYAHLIPYASDIKRVILFGPAHRFGFRGLATLSANAMLTPLGHVRIDDAYRDKVTQSSVQILDQAFDGEHSLEVQLPFLQSILDNFTILPILVGDAQPAEVSTTIEHCWADPETLIVISSDLSHFHDHITAEQMDARTTAHIEALAPEKITYEDACGRIPINGLLLAAKQAQLKASTIARQNSSDVGADKQRVVGYGAYLFS